MTALCLTPSVIGAILVRPRPRPTLFPYTTLFRSDPKTLCGHPRTGEWRCCDIKRLEACPKSHFSIGPESPQVVVRSEEHTSELQSPCNLVCRLLLETKTAQGIRTSDREARRKQR